MKRLFATLLLVATIAMASAKGEATWRSALYPENWTPGMEDAEGRFLHDFSYAGYHMGMREIPNVRRGVVDVTKEPYNADCSGREDVTRIVQRAIDDVAERGGGVVYLPKGEYRMSVERDAEQGLLISSDNVILRGAGADKTFIKNSSTYMRYKEFIAIRPQGGSTWLKADGVKIAITEDLMRPTKTIPVAQPDTFKVGDLVILTSEVTQEFVEEHKSTDFWSAGSIRAAHYCREVVAVDKERGCVEIDIPTRYPLTKRDRAVIYKASRHIKECGVEYLSIGNVQHPAPATDKVQWHRDAYLKEGTAAYDVHQSHLIYFDRAMDCWVRGVSSYCVEENTEGFHSLSNFIFMGYSRTITIADCDLRHTQYEGAGGNGYMFTMVGNDCLVRDCYAENGRHHYDFKSSLSSGNVVLNCVGCDSFLPTDYHMHLSIANLIDGFVADGDYIDAAFRLAGTFPRIHSYSATECVMWNTRGVKPHGRSQDLIVSNQFGWGYVIGTSGTPCSVKSDGVVGEKVSRDWRTAGLTARWDGSPEDYVEGVGRGESLMPQSLYEDQLKRRIERDKTNK